MNVQGWLILAGLFLTLITFIIQTRLANRTRLGEIYQELEVASNDVFRFEAEHADRLAPFLNETPPAQALPASDRLIADNRLFQILNLFEIATRFRRKRFFEPDVYASWVAWQFDLLQNWHFRAVWPTICDNYTSDLRQIFDQPVADHDDDVPYAQQKAGFYLHVAKTMMADKAYISHGEIMAGLSPDGRLWAADTPEKTRTWLHKLYETPPNQPERPFLCAAYDQKKDLVAAAVLTWHDEAGPIYIVLEDMVVRADARGAGIGRALLDEVMAKTHGHWLFLESGLHNSAAHGFFKASGFRTVSHVFARAP
ncbi:MULTISPECIES: GNAT family N-acetyltransferase [unclassified Iodidimonas]|jgi:GNAT superfamily N-acetyltransferase|uniref:GNAT family N-acetyltransferase n=1 Tax=unclassified Iodidimonas TaxID=2626145 RepID=UPI002482F0C8|nr:MULTISPECIES: GNAT family N-acetyltransferase [unclassified Iodidimonas]